MASRDPGRIREWGLCAPGPDRRGLGHTHPKPGVADDQGAASRAPRRGARVKRVCFVGRVRAERLAAYRERHERVWPGMLAAYRERHGRVWPGMLAALREAGWGNYSLFLTEDD
jgi:L-rhamnose mutarotase